MAEAQFLASRQSRLEARQQHYSRRSLDLFQYWDSVKQYLSAWDGRLNGIAVPVNESDKRQVKLHLAELQQELIAFRKRCLSFGTPTESDSILPSLTTVVELPLSDLRALHAEFAKHQGRLDQVRRTLLPKGKFVFRKYRQALKEQAQHRVGGVADISLRAKVHAKSAAATPTTTTKTIDTNKAKDPYTLRGIENRTVLVDSEGWLREDKLPVEQAISIVDGQSPVILRDLRHCTVELDGSFQAAHMLNVSDSTIRFRKKVVGAVHVTECHDTVIEVQCQQLRIHESNNLQCLVHVSAGAILEDSHAVTFVVSSEIVVKDFSFLNQGAVSPNYAIKVSRNAPKPAATRQDAPAASGNVDSKPSESVGSQGPVSETYDGAVDSDESDGEL